MNRRMFACTIAHLILYETQMGDLNVADDYVAPDGYDLGVKVSQIRELYRQGGLDQEWIKRLERIGFAFDRKLQDWETMYRRAADYVVENGTLPDVSYRTEDNVLLGAWVYRQDRVYARLTEWQKEKLKGIGIGK